MGIEYYIADTNRRIFYALGKGGWYTLDHDHEVFQDQEYLTHYILEECYHRDYHSEDEWKEIVKYVSERVAPDLFHSFGTSSPNKLRIFNDCGDDLVIIRAKGYLCIGHRYDEINSQAYIDDLNRYNRHLSGDPMNKKWYDPEQYKKYPEWELY